MLKNRDGSTLFILAGLGVCLLVGGWAALNASAVDDLKARVRQQRKDLDAADKVRIELTRLRQLVRPETAGAPNTNNIALIQQMASDAQIPGAKLKGINALPRVERPPWIEMGYVIELADVGREALARLLVGVEKARPALRTKEIHIRKFTPEGDISGATVHIVYYEKKEEKKDDRKPAPVR